MLGQHLPWKMTVQGLPTKKVACMQSHCSCHGVMNTCRCNAVGGVQELHTRYYEPLARIASSLEEIVQGPPMKKLLFMTDSAAIDNELKPHWEVGHLLPLENLMSHVDDHASYW